MPKNFSEIRCPPGFNSIEYFPPFEKDFRKLRKKYNTLGSDLNLFVNVQLKLYHIRGKDNQGIFPISNKAIASIEYPYLYIAKKFRCRAMQGKGVHSGIRVVYAYYEFEKIADFIQIYYHEKDSTNMDYDRAKRYLKEYNKIKTLPLR